MSTGKNFQHYKPDIWGGIECTINRVKDEFKDQLFYSGHYLRKNDIRKFARLEISALRYPLLWEYHQPRKGSVIDWEWASGQLEAIRKSNITPIIGLVHHGSGPAYTDLMQKDFAEGLAAYALQVAEKFPWINYYTPVNEPLTTARFSGLYGMWYPHHKNDHSFVLMLCHQLRAVVLSMQAIKKVNPEAKLIQTEDLSKIYSSPSLTYQADFENERRWLTFDLLCGKVDKSHYLWDYLTKYVRISESYLQFFLENICIPDIIGLNYYVTSERYLDEETKFYPSCTHSTNGKHFYADVEAVRVYHDHPCGLEVLLKEAWNRYHLTLAITEVHMNCGREHQLRWLKQIWDVVCNLKMGGIDIKAVTAWSLLGSYGWNSLLTGNMNHYEPGVFVIRNGKPYETAVAKMLRSLSINKQYHHPLVEQPGWWETDSRFIHSKDKTGIPSIQKKTKASPILIVGKNGTLASAFAKVCEQRHIHSISLSRCEMNGADERQVEKIIEREKPWAVINASGYVRVDDAEENAEECFTINVKVPSVLAKICQRYSLPFMTFSSDLVFNGSKHLPYIEWDDVKPLNVYGRSKAESEWQVVHLNDTALVIRTSSFFGPWDQFNFAHFVIDSLKHAKSIEVANDVFISPTYVPDLVNIALDLFIDEEKGIWHLCNNGTLSWAEFAGEVAERAGLSKRKLIKKSMAEMQWKAKRPLHSSLKSGKGIQLPDLSCALNRYFNEKKY